MDSESTLQDQRWSGTSRRVTMPGQGRCKTSAHHALASRSRSRVSGKMTSALEAKSLEPETETKHEHCLEGTYSRQLSVPWQFGHLGARYHLLHCYVGSQVAFAGLLFKTQVPSVVDEETKSPKASMLFDVSSCAFSELGINTNKPMDPVAIGNSNRNDKKAQIVVSASHIFPP